MGKKFFLQTCFLALLMIGTVSCSTIDPKYKVSHSKDKPKSNLVVRTTAYTHTESDHVKYGRLAATGTKLKSGNIRSAAADWSEFPVGTTFRIKQYPKYTFVVDDYGSALVGTKTIDLYQTTKSKMREWGVRNVEIEVIQWGCLSKSKAILQDRLRYAHIRKMNESISNKLKI